MKNGNIILVLAIFMMGLSLVPADLVALNMPSELSSKISAQPRHSSMTRLHEVSQNSLRSKSLKNKKRAHHPTQRPADPLSLHHARPFFILTSQDAEVHAVLTSAFYKGKPFYIGSIHPSDYITKIFHPPTV
ncbi:MAG TPA: hypothetical protein VN763_06620 [Saprospiraceae bacterium]|nr:hypothetical protein [Saprospiraceae bacterium]